MKDLTLSTSLRRRSSGRLVRVSESTPSGRTRRIASKTLSGPRPPASITGASTEAAMAAEAPVMGDAGGAHHARGRVGGVEEEVVGRLLEATRHLPVGRGANGDGDHDLHGSQMAAQPGHRLGGHPFGRPGQVDDAGLE